MKPALSIKSKLFVLILCTSLVAVFGISVTHIIIEKRLLKNSTINWQSEIAKAKKKELLSLVEKFKKQTQGCAGDGYIISHLLKIHNRQCADREGIVNDLNRYLLKRKIPFNPDMRAMAITDLAGQVISSTHDSWVGMDMSSQKVFKQIEGRRFKDAYVSQPVFLPYLNADCICVSSLVYSGVEDEKIGAVIIAYDLDAIGEIMCECSRMYSTGEVVLAVNDDRGIVRFSSLRFEKDVVTKLTPITDSGKGIPMRMALKGMSGVVEAVDYRGVEVMANYQYIPSLQWGLVIKVDKLEVFAPLRRLKIITLIIGVVNALASVIVGNAFSSSIVRIIKVLKNAMMEYERGNLRFRIRIFSRDEFESLANSINAMAEMLDKEMKEHKRARDDLQKGYNIMNVAIEETSDVIYVKDSEGRYMLINSAGVRFFGKRMDEILGRNDFELFPYQIAQMINDNDRKIMSTGKIQTFEEELFLSESDTQYTFFTSKGVFRDQQGNVCGIVGISRNINERKVMEQELRLLNESLERRVMERTAALQKANDELQREISERRRTEDALLTSEKRYRTLSELSPVGIFYTDIEGNCLFANEKWSEITGVRLKDAMGEGWITGLHPEDRQRVIQEWQNITKEKPGFQSEYRFIHSSGMTVWVYGQALAERDDAGEIIGCVVAVTDITEHIRLDESLRRSKRLLENAERIAKIGSWEWDIENDMITWSGETYRIHGINPQEKCITCERFLRCICPDDRELVNSSIEDALYKNKPYSIDFRVVLPNGMKRVVHAEGEVEYGTDCAPLWMRGSVQDITMQKSRENDIKSYAFQQECLADLCRYLLSEGTISTIVNETSDVIVKAFGAEYSAIFKLLPDGKTLLLAGGVGWRERITGIATVDSSQPDCCLLSDNPIVIKDLKTDMRLTGVKIFSEHSIISGISVIVKVKNRPYGVLGVYVTKQRAFSDSEVDCLQTISNVLALSIERKIAEDSTRELAETLEQRVRERTREQVEAYNKLQVEILESKRKEEELYKSEGKYRLLVESLPQGIFYKDRNLVYVSCNENYARILSLKPEEIPGKTDYDLYPKELADTYARDDAKIIESGNMMDVEEKYIKDERELFIHTVKVPVRDKKGSIVGILGNYSDITEKVMLRMESVRLRQLVSIGELAAGVAHEINNPINSIINYAQILINSASDTDTGREKDIATRILKEGDRIAKIVGSLLSFARKSGKEDMRLVHIQEILSEAVILTGAQLRKDGIKTKVAISPVLSQIQVNVQQILQVFMNIISNARYALNEKYREKHDNKILEIIVGEMTTDGKAFVRTLFLDHGTGIPKDIMDKVMNPFFTTKPRSKGTGLGLSISQGIINDHGGKLKIESIEGEFTKVTVILPAVKE